MAYDQLYRTESVVNTRISLYTLSIFNPGGAKTPYQSYTFPLSPSNMRKEFSSMAAMYDTQGTSEHYGVERLVDQFGMSPPIFSLEGTTGWKKHLSDNFQFTGLESIKQIESMLYTFAKLNADQSQSRKKELYTMEFYDYFSGDYWEVVPIGPQAIRQDQRQPLLFYYNFRFAGLKSVSAPSYPTNKTDPITQAFNLAINTVSQTVQNFIGGIESTYNSIGGLL